MSIYPIIQSPKLEDSENNKTVEIFSSFINKSSTLKSQSNSEITRKLRRNK